mgnify:FL=1
MSWRNIVKLEPDVEEPLGESGAEDREEKRLAEARKHLEIDVGNVLRELEEFEGLGMGQMDVADEMEELSNALGKVSVLLQEWI